MPRPIWKDVLFGLENWDAAVRDNFLNLSARPAALVEIVNGGIGAFPAANFTRCFASYETSPGVWAPVWSNGTNWLNLISGAVVA